MAVKAKEYRDYTKPELEDALSRLEEEVFQLRIQSKTKKLDKPHKVSAVRCSIARVKTFLRQQEIKEKKSGA
ncbi:MAG: 50S ribosomal protein L29 [Candidatus Omnitrophica bacterium]|nr:50S ribosomal protein L29 [Candidatus Omnitrophota bacterium]